MCSDTFSLCHNLHEVSCSIGREIVPKHQICAPGFFVRKAFLGLKASPFIRQTEAICLWPKAPASIHDQKPTFFCECSLAKGRRVFMCLFRRNAFLALLPVNPSFHNVLCYVDLENSMPAYSDYSILLWMFFLGWYWLLTQFFWHILAKISIFILVFHGSRPFECYFWALKTGAKNWLDMASFPLPFLLASTIGALISTVNSFLLANLTPLLLEQECQRLQKTTLVSDIRTLQID